MQQLFVHESKVTLNKRKLEKGVRITDRAHLFVFGHEPYTLKNFLSLKGYEAIWKWFMENKTGSGNVLTDFLEKQEKAEEYEIIYGTAYYPCY